MLDDYGQDSYKILSGILKLRFSAQLKNSGIVFENIYQLKDLVSGKDFFMLEVNSTQIRFVTKRDFLIHFMRFLTKNIEFYNKRYNELITRRTDKFTDEVGLQMEYKRIDYYKIKQIELLEVLNGYYNNEIEKLSK